MDNIGFDASMHNSRLTQLFAAHIQNHKNLLLTTNAYKSVDKNVVFIINNRTQI